MQNRFPNNEFRCQRLGRSLALPVIVFSLAAVSPTQGQQPASTATRPKFNLAEQILAKMPDADTDKDGKLSRDEIRAVEKQLDQQGSGMAIFARAPTAKDVSYGPHERDVLDFWQAESTRPTPLIVYIHGGGFMYGDKADPNPAQIEQFLDWGISFASITYRYTTQASYPAPMLDGARAIQFLRTKAKDWNLDPHRIAAYGESAGAGISMWLAFHDDLADPNSSDPVLRQSSRLTCAGSLGGQSSYDPLQIKEWLGGRAWENVAFYSFYGIKDWSELERPEIRKLAFDASVINHLTADDAPVFLSYYEPETPLTMDMKPGDGIHHPIFGHKLQDRMNELGIESVFRHEKDGKEPNRHQHMLEWFRQKLEPDTK